MNVEPPDRSIASVVRALPAGARLDEFEVEQIIGEGSTTIVYGATDRARSIPVAIAEYMPALLAQRHGAQVAPRTSAQADAFAKGLKAFISETRTLARCNHPSLVRIVRLSEANGTAYRVMPRYTATRLLEARQGMNEPPDEEAVRALLDALLGALGTFHLAGGVHGKVTPSNILLLPDKRPLLLAPGGAGRAIAGDRIDALMTSEEPCFVPIEQMVESSDIPLRPSVDLYALAGVARFWISGELPAPVFAASRSPRRERLADTVQRLRLTWPRLHYSAALLDALDSALSIYPAERPKDVAQMRTRLGSAPAAVVGRVSAASNAAPAVNDVPLPASPALASQPAVNDAAPSIPASAPQLAPNDAVPESPSPAPAPQPAPLAPQPASLAPHTAPPDPVTQDLEVVTSFPPDPDPPATSGLARIDDDWSGRTAFARQARRSRRIAKWSGAVLVLLVLLVIGGFEFGQEGRFGRVLDVLGIDRGTAVADKSAVSATAESPATSAPPIAADSSASASTPTGAPIAADAASAPITTKPAAADSAASATAPASPASAPAAADAGVAKPASTETAVADSPARTNAPPSLPSPDGTTLSATAPTASAEPAAVAQPPAALAPPRTRSVQQLAARAPASPREACGPRTQFSLYRCMKTQCSQRRWSSHAQCERLRITDSVD